MFPPRPLRILRMAIGLVPLLAAGCFVPIGYAYPTVSVTPAVDVGKQADEVRVFRIDIADVSGCCEFGWGPDRYVFHPIHLFENGRGLPQVGMALDYGWIWNCIALIFDKHTSHKVLVRAYRPGFRTVEIKPWQTSGKVLWEEASGLDAQERAVDALISTMDTDPQARGIPRPEATLFPEGRPAREAFLLPCCFRSLAPGSAGSGHREALLFAAAEYERLSGTAKEDQRVRLWDKAQSLRGQADQ
jgi:hypothetical protein